MHKNEFPVKNCRKDPGNMKFKKWSSSKSTTYMFPKN